jgi:hypothetical protein
LIKERVWQTRSQLEVAIVEYLGLFNNARLHASLGDIPLAEFELLHHDDKSAAVSLRSPAAMRLTTTSSTNYYIHLRQRDPIN